MHAEARRRYSSSVSVETHAQGKLVRLLSRVARAWAVRVRKHHWAEVGLRSQLLAEVRQVGRKLEVLLWRRDFDVELRVVRNVEGDVVLALLADDTALAHVDEDSLAFGLRAGVYRRENG